MRNLLAAATWILLVLGAVAFFTGVTSPSPEVALRGFTLALLLWILGGVASIIHDKLDRRFP